MLVKIWIIVKSNYIYKFQVFFGNLLKLVDIHSYKCYPESHDMFRNVEVYLNKIFGITYRATDIIYNNNIGT